VVFGRINGHFTGTHRHLEINKIKTYSSNLVQHVFIKYTSTDLHHHFHLTEVELYTQLSDENTIQSLPDE
jgi:hypothetical protein